MVENCERVDTQDGRVLFVFDYLGDGQGKVSFDVTEFSQGNMMINATNMAKMFPGKLIGDFLRLQSTKEYIRALESDTRIPITGLCKVVQGGTPQEQGTWMYKTLALKFAKWLNPYFGIWCHGIERFILQSAISHSGIDLSTTGYFGGESNYIQVEGQDILMERFRDPNNGIEVTVPINVTQFEENNTMIYVTDLLQVYPDKKINNFLRNSYTKRYLEALSSVTRFPVDQLLQIVKGNFTGGSKQQGTWMHWNLALEFAHWLNPHFGVWCDMKVLEVFQRGMTTVYPQELQKFHGMIGNLKTEVADLKDIVNKNQPKVDYYDNVLSYSGKLYTSTEALVAMNLDKTISSAKSLHQILIDEGYAYRVGDMLRMKQPFGKLDLQRMETVVIDNKDGSVPKVIKTVKWTEYGISQLFAILGSLGYRPRPF